MKGILKFFADRFKERSTWLGITALATAVGIKAEPEQFEAVTTLGLALGGIIAAFTKDKTPPVK